MKNKAFKVGKKYEHIIHHCWEELTNRYCYYDWIAGLSKTTGL